MDFLKIFIYIKTKTLKQRQNILHFFPKYTITGKCNKVSHGATQIILFYLVCSVYLTTESTKCRTLSCYKLNKVTSKSSTRFILKRDKDKENWPFFHTQYLNIILLSNSNKSNYFLPGYTNLKSSNRISIETQTG